MKYINSFSDIPEVNSYMAAATGELAFDIGANGGFLAKVLARTFTKVVACEPAIESFEKLVPKCPIPNLICLNVAVSDHEGSVNLGVKAKTDEIGELFTGDSLADWGPDLGRRDVPCTTLDLLALHYGMPDFVKIDTEGHEAFVVAGGHGVFESYPRFSVEIHDDRWGQQIQSYFDSIKLAYRIIPPPPQYRQGDDIFYWMVSV